MIILAMIKTNNLGVKYESHYTLSYRNRFGFFALTCVFDVIYDNNTQYDYTYKIVVDKPEKIDQAISNAINDVESHRFKVMSLNVEKLYTRPFGFGDIRYVIRCSGMTDVSVLNM